MRSSLLVSLMSLCLAAVLVAGEKISCVHSVSVPDQPTSDAAELTGSESDSTDELFRLAFGKGCPEVDRCIRLHFPAHKFAFAAKFLELETDGRTKMAPCSIIRYRCAEDGKKTNLTTIRSEWALITLDKPATNTVEMVTDRRILDIEFADGSHWKFDK